MDNGNRTSKETHKVYLTWDYIELAIDRLATQIKVSKLKINAIKGLQRGGLIPAVMLSHKLGIPMADSSINGNDVLIVDDICDSGVTLNNYTAFRCPTATIHYKRTAVMEPTYWCDLVQEHEWIVYPWEQKDSKTIADYATKGK